MEHYIPIPYKDGTITVIIIEKEYRKRLGYSYM